MRTSFSTSTGKKLLALSLLALSVAASAEYWTAWDHTPSIKHYNYAVGRSTGAAVSRSTEQIDGNPTVAHSFNFAAGAPAGSWAGVAEISQWWGGDPSMGIHNMAFSIQGMYSSASGQAAVPATSVGFVIYQNGHYYRAPIPASTMPTAGTWCTYSTGRLTAQSFVEFSPSTNTEFSGSHPDFSATGPVFHFGWWDSYTLPSVASNSGQQIKSNWRQLKIETNTADGYFYSRENYVVGGQSIVVGQGVFRPAPVGGVAFSLSSASSLVTVPSSIYVPEGRQGVPFTITTSRVTTPTTVRITSVSEFGATATFDLRLDPPVISSLTFPSSTVASGGTVTGTVTLLNTDSYDTNVVLTCSGNGTIPSHVTIPAGSKTASFTFTAATVTSNKTATITAATKGDKAQASISIRVPALQAVSLSPMTVNGGGTSTFTVQLNCPAPAGGETVSVGCGAGATLDSATVFIPAGSSTGTVTVQAGTTTSTKTVAVSATFAGVKRTSKLTINP